jgi:betaine-aldehyde dehydrogenase
MIEYDALYIGGEWVKPSGSHRFQVISPSTEEVIGSVPAAEPADMDLAVAAAKSAMDRGNWFGLGASARAMVLRRLAAGLDENAEELANLLTAEAGTVLQASMGAVQASSKRCRYYADLIETVDVEELRASIPQPVIVRKEPVGVVAAIVPWNAPLSLAFLKLAPALAAGCAIVLKPAPETPLATFFLAKFAEEAGLPKGILSIVPAGPAASEHLIRHRDVAHVSFTGSTAVGRKVGAICGENIKPVTLELGGKSAAIILPDADIVRLAPALAATTMMNNGQACVLQSRVLIPRARYRETIKALAAEVAKLKVGDPFDPAARVGPLISKRQREIVANYVSRAQGEGARLMLGGNHPPGLAKGWFFEPTVLSDCNPGMTIAREEVFGPVVACIAYSDEDEAVRIANDSDFGLSGTVWTADLERGLQVARRMQVGNYGVNCFGMDVAAPFGGYKASGLGRELGPEGLEAFFQTKSIHLPVGADPTAITLA